MALEAYRTKRDFRQTPEPTATVAQPHQQPLFVIQEHHASHLHYDFRLEADAVLKSWAVPKQPSLDPAQKRLAVRVEDHPLAYADFAGTIPEGQYGAGTVAIWDRGTYENLLAEKTPPQTVTEGIAAGRLEFVLHGQRLQGRFALIRMKRSGRGKENWLLIKTKDEHTRSMPAHGVERPAPARATRARHAPAARPVVSAAQPAPKDIAVTHPDKLLFPEASIHKGQVFGYYRRIADRLLPYLRDRPVTLERLPEGLGGTRQRLFWQKNTPASYPAWIPRIELASERGRSVHYAVVNDVPTLLYLVNQNAVTFHVWLSRTRSLDRPDFVLFDLDPGEAAFADVVAVARELHSLLEAEGKEACVKTSGKSGLHVLVPWHVATDYDEARSWADGLAERLVAALPEQATREARKARRGRRVFVDVTENARGRHVVPPYVLRATPHASLSMPLFWQELAPDLNPVLDYDGTLCGEDARFMGMPREAGRESTRLLRSGLVLGVATGRGKSVKAALRDAIPKEYWGRVVVGYYNGGDIGLLGDDTCPDGSDRVSESLRPVADAIAGHPLLGRFAQFEFRPLPCGHGQPPLGGAIRKGRWPPCRRLNLRRKWSGVTCAPFWTRS